jgi:hypothetical protein
VTGDGAKDADERSEFAGSLLDWSVNYSHGPDGGRGEAAREMARVREKAELLDEQHRR